MIENALITGTSLGFEGPDILTAWLHLEGENWGCGYGGYALDNWDREQHRRVPGGKSMDAIVRIMDTVGVKKWEDLKGKYIRVDHEGWGGTVNKIGHLIKDKWFSYQEFFKEENA